MLYFFLVFFLFKTHTKKTKHKCLRYHLRDTTIIKVFFSNLIIEKSIIFVEKICFYGSGVARWYYTCATVANLLAFHF